MESFLQKRALEKSQEARDNISARFSSQEGFYMNSRQDLIFISNTILFFLYGDDSPVVSFADNTRAYIHLSMTARLVNWSFVEDLLADERTIQKHRLFLLSSEEFEAYDDSLTAEVKKF